MIVVVISSCPPSLRGDLTRWLFEIQTGVYVGNPPAKVRDNLWLRIEATLKSGRAVMVISRHNEQGFEFRTANSKFEPIDFDGITLMMHPLTEEKQSAEPMQEFKKPVYRTTPERSKKHDPPRFVLPDDFVILDIETTGLDNKKDCITEIGALKVHKGEITDEFNRLIQSPVEPADSVIKLNGLTCKLLNENGVNICHALHDLFKFIGHDSLFIYNADFDLGFLSKAAENCGYHFEIGSVTDTLKEARKSVKGVKSYKLQILLDHFGYQEKLEHRAIPDCKAILFLLEKMKEL